MDDDSALRHMLVDIVFMETVGMRVVVVHGGGKAINRAMAEANIEPRFIQGRRYTDDATLNALLAAFDSPDESQVLHALELLPTLDKKTRHAKDKVLALVKHPSLPVRLEALRFIGEHGGFEDAEQLSAELHDSNEEVRAHAVRAILPKVVEIAGTTTILYPGDAAYDDARPGSLTDAEPPGPRNRVVMDASGWRSVRSARR